MVREYKDFVKMTVDGQRAADVYALAVQTAHTALCAAAWEAFRPGDLSRLQFDDPKYDAGATHFTGAAHLKIEKVGAHPGVDVDLELRYRRDRDGGVGLEVGHLPSDPAKAVRYPLAPADPTAMTRCVEAISDAFAHAVKRFYERD